MSEAKVVSWEEWARWVNKQLAENKRKIEAINDSLANLIRRLEPLVIANLSSKILEALREEGQPKSWRWFQHRFGDDAWEALNHLEAQGMVVVTRSGRHTMYSAKES